MYFIKIFARCLFLLPCILSVFLFVPGLSVSQEKDISLSKESTQLLEQTKKGVEDYNDKLKSGKMVFLLTYSIQSSNQQKNAKKVAYEDVGTWHITYNFDGHRHFYDVRIRNKIEFNGKVHLNWKKNHYQFQIDDKKMLIRELKDTGWVQHPQPTEKSIFKSEFNPRRWGWNPGVFSFRSRIKYASPINVEQVEVEGVQLYLLTLHRVRHEKSTMTEQLWIDPQKGYRPIRVLTTIKDVAMTFLGNPDGTLKPQKPEERVSHTHSTFQIEQFDPGIWFPKTALYETGYDLTKQRSYKKLQMQVHKAIFNIPIDEKDLRFPD